MTDPGPNTPSEPVEGFGTPFRPQSGDVDLDAAVSRFVELSDTAGNPGAPQDPADRRLPTGRIIAALDRCPSPDGLTFAAIDAAVPDAPTSAVQHALDDLVQRGWVARFPNDRGKVAYVTTDEPRTEGDG